MKRKRDNQGIVYSTEQGPMCPGCGQPVNKCKCKISQPLRRGDGVVRLGRLTKGRKGKTVTMLSGFELEPDEISALAQELKRKCGTGGTVKGSVIEIQGDHRTRLVEVLRQMGYQVKLSGG